MSGFATFFKDSDSIARGDFYPKDYIIVAFAAMSTAERAHKGLLEAGIPEEECLLMTGEEMHQLLSQVREDTGFWGDAMRSLSRFIGTEAYNADTNMKQAAGGAAFIAIYSPEEEKALRVAEVLKKYSPPTIDWYRWGGIRSLLETPIS